MHVPTRFRDRVREIDPDLDLVWLDREQRYAIIQRLYNTPSVDEMVSRVAREARPKFSEKGYAIDHETMCGMMYPLISRECVVFRIEDEDGRPRPLDERDLVRLRRMAWKRRTRSVDDWIAASDAMIYEAEMKRQMATADMWSYLARDSVFLRIFQDTVAGLNLKHCVGGPLPTPAAEAAA